jgi:hypothetical protein
MNFHEFKVKKETSKNFGKIMAKILLEDVYNHQLVMTVFATQLEKLKKRLKDFLRKNGELQVGLAIRCSGASSYYENSLSLLYTDLLDVKLPPALPLDLAHKQVATKSKKSLKKQDLEEKSEDEILEIINEDLLEQGDGDLEFYPEENDEYN